MAFAAAVVLALLFAFTNGFHDAANAVAALVAVRGARPAQAVVLASICNLAGPLVLGAAVADTVAGIIEVPVTSAVAVVGAALTAATGWNVITWRRGTPSSSSHALVGGLVGAGVVDAGVGAVRWGGFSGGRPVGVLGVLAALVVAPVLGMGMGAWGERIARRLLRRSARPMAGPVRVGSWAASGVLALSHGANDAAKTVGIVAVLLAATGRHEDLGPPWWVGLVAGLALTAGTAVGGWGIVATIGRRIYRIRPLDGFTSTASSALVLGAASVLGAPISTTQVVASSVVGVGFGRDRRRRIRWGVVRDVGAAWLVTLPACAIMAGVLLPVWKVVA